MKSRIALEARLTGQFEVPPVGRLNKCIRKSWKINYGNVVLSAPISRKVRPPAEVGPGVFVGLLTFVRRTRIYIRLVSINQRLGPPKAEGRSE
jgi:hypothetical protein